MNDPKLGVIIDGQAYRDAIHVAILPLEAPTDLDPGQHIDQFGDPFGTPVGIVDPFLKHRVQKGQRFYLCLFPGSVTSLRHHWEHPAVADIEPPKPDAAVVEASGPGELVFRQMREVLLKQMQEFRDDLTTEVREIAKRAGVEDEGFSCAC